MSKNSEKYFEFLAWSMMQTAAEPDRLSYVLGINHGADSDAVYSITKHMGLRATIIDAHVETGYGSENHGACLDIIFEGMKRSASVPYGISRCAMLIDCDIAFLEPHWDEKMLAKLTADCVIVGAEYDGEKYLGFPNVIGAMFELDAVTNAGVSFYPEGRKTVVDDELPIYGYSRDLQGVSIKLDTGSELPRKLKAAGKTGCPMGLFRSQSLGAVFMQGEMRGEEYQLDGVPLFTHLGRSYTREFGVDEHALLWEKRVREWLNARPIR